MAQHASGKTPVALPPPFSRHPAVSTLSGELKSALSKLANVGVDNGLSAAPCRQPMRLLHPESSCCALCCLYAGPTTAGRCDTVPCVATNLPASMPAASHDGSTRLSGQLQDWMSASHARGQAHAYSMQDSHSATSASWGTIPTVYTQQAGIGTAYENDSTVPSTALLQAAAVSADLQAILQKLQQTQLQDDSTAVKSLERVLLSSFASNTELHSVASGNPHPSMPLPAQPAASLAARLAEYQAPAHVPGQGMHAMAHGSTSGQSCSTSTGDFAGWAEQQPFLQGAAPALLHAASTGPDSRAAPAVFGALQTSQHMAGSTNTLALADGSASDGSACLPAAHVMPADSQSTAGYDGGSGVLHSAQLQEHANWQVQHVAARSWPSEGMFIKPHRSQKAQLHRSSLFSPAESAGADDSRMLLAHSSHALQASNRPQASGAASSSAPKLPQALQQQQTGSTGTLPGSAGHSSAAMSAGASGHIMVPTPTEVADSTVSSGSTCSSLQCAPGPAAVSNAQHMPPSVDVNGLPLMGPLTASLRTSRPRSKKQSALARPTLSGAPAAAAATGGSILDTIELKWEGGSSAAAIHRIEAANPVHPAGCAAAAPKATSQHGRAPGRALEQLADRAATLLHQQPQRHVSRLQAASYPAASLPSMHDAAAVPPHVPEGPEGSAAHCMEERSIRAAPSAQQASSMPPGCSSQQEAAAAAASESSTTNPTQRYCSDRYTKTMSVHAASILPEPTLQDLRPLRDSRRMSQHGMQPQHNNNGRMSDVTDTLHAAAQLRDGATASGSQAGSNSVGATGYAASHTVTAAAAAGSSAHSLGGSRLSLWQRKPTAGLPLARQHSVRSELRASLTGALRTMTGAVRSSVSKHVSLQPSQQLQPVSPPAPFLSPLEPASSLSSAAGEVYLTPETADSESDASRSCSSSSSVQDSLADTAQSAPTYALRPHMMGLSRSTPFVGLHGDAGEDYVL
jgi:hypothetical protein